ncbi:MAG: hypothetical protein ABJE95_08050 [Byssovorax sp.]
MSDQPSDVPPRPLYVTQRLRYYDGEFLDTQSFIDEQDYHVDLQARHEATLHVAGILEGLVVAAAVDADNQKIPFTVTVTQGSAIDAVGNQILLWDPDDKSGVSPQLFKLSELKSATTYCVDVLFRESPTPTGSEATRYAQLPKDVLQISQTQRADSVLIAVVTTDGDGAVTISNCGTQGSALYAGHHLPGPAGKDAILRVDNVQTDRTKPADYRVVLSSSKGTPMLEVSDAGLTLKSGYLTFPVITTGTTGDPAPTITSRLVPASQCGGTHATYLDGNDQERSELILFHSNDYQPKWGPDFITLRAPAIRLQTYANDKVLDIANDAGCNDRLYIDPNGMVGIGTATTMAAVVSPDNVYPNVPTAQLDVKAADGHVGLNVTSASGQVGLQVKSSNATDVVLQAQDSGVTVPNGTMTVSKGLLTASAGLSVTGGSTAPALVVKSASGQDGLRVLASGGSTSLQVLDTGRVGIGVGASTPIAQLDVKAAAGAIGLNVTGASNATALLVNGSSGQAAFQIIGSASATLLQVRDDGKVGIGLGATNPTTQLDLKAASGNAGLKITSASGQPGLQVIASNGSTLLQVDDSGATGVLGLLTAQSGLTIKGGQLTLPVPTADGAPTISARVIPADQCGGSNANNAAGNDQERSELILFHSNDGFNGFGPDFITLRAPAIRLQTFNNTTVQNITLPAGSNDRLYIDPDGKVGIGTAIGAQSSHDYPNNPNAQLEVRAGSNNVGLSVKSASSSLIGFQVKTSSTTTDSNVLEVRDSGVTVPNGTLEVSSGLLTAKKGLTVSGAVLTASTGLTVSGGLLTANDGLTVSGVTSVMRAWENTKFEFDSAYTASTDGFVLAWIKHTNIGDNGTLCGYSDDLTNAKAYASIHWQTGSGADVKVDSNSFLMPVRNGTTWKVTKSGTGATGLHWMPLGKSS